jgi:phosphoglycolate phosphatase-like HAD superfamily hydrolase
MSIGSSMSPHQPPRPIRQFDLIAFDWDGTLFDSTAIITRCIQMAVVDVGGRMPSEKDAAYVIGLGLMQALAHAAPDVPGTNTLSWARATSTTTCAPERYQPV